MRTKGGVVILVVYIDDMLLSGSNDTSILTTKTYLTLVYIDDM